MNYNPDNETAFEGQCEQIRHEADIVPLLAAFDAALAAYRLMRPFDAHGLHSGRRQLVVFPSLHPHAEYALRLWCGAQGLAPTEHVSRYDSAPWFRNEQIRSLQVLLDGREVISLQFDAEPIVKDARVQIDGDAAWSPVDGGTL